MLVPIQVVYDTESEKVALRVTSPLSSGDVVLSAERRANLDEETRQKLPELVSQDKSLEEQKVQVIRDRALEALRSNRDYLQNRNKTAADHAAQIEALTRQNQGIIRMLLGDYSDGED